MLPSIATPSTTENKATTREIHDVPFDTSNTIRLEPLNDTHPLHNSVQNQNSVTNSRNRSKSSSLSDKNAVKLTTFEAASNSQGNTSKATSKTPIKIHPRTVFTPTGRNYNAPRRRSLSSNTTDGEKVSIKNSMVITNSRLVPDVCQKQSLSSITFGDKICFALPPKLTVEELNYCPAHEVDYLLRMTREMNMQLKKKKKRSRKPRDNQQFDHRRANQPSISKSAANRTLVKPEPFKSQNFKVEKPKETIADAEASFTKPQNNLPKKQLKQISPSDLLKLCDQNIPENPQIIDVVRKLKIFSENPPVCELIDENKIKSMFKKPPITPNIKLMKNLMQPSWLELEDNGEEKSSREIYENLKHAIQNCDDKDIRNLNEVTAEEKSKKKKDKKKLENREIKNKTQSDVEDPATLIFEDYYDEERIAKGLQDGSLFKDLIRINQKNYKEAYLFCPNDSRDIFIDGVRDRNRALEGDEVLVDLHPEEKWKIHSDESVQKCGKVVFVTKQNHPRTAVGYLRIAYKKNKLDKVLLCPRDSRIPRVKIPVNLCPPNVKSDHKRYENVLFEAKIVKWETVNFAEGFLVRELGEHNDLETETKCLLLENHLDVEPVENIDAYLSTSDSTIPEEEIQRRLDIRTQCVFTIDPVGAKDLDDALSCVELPNGNFEVGVHIADVSHYLLPDTPLDENACQKATSVYLTQKVFHMLPNKLCDLCSLTPSADKLTFSLIVELDPDAQIVNHKFTKTVIRSCTQFAYHHAQEIIDKGTEGLNVEDFPKIENGFTLEDCAATIVKLRNLARKMRKRRFDGGALKIDQPKILFKLDENNLPSSYSLFVAKESNWLIEEFMLLANILTANRLREHYPDLALLRYHSPPNENSMSTVVESLEKIGIYIDNSNAGSIHRSMMRYEGSDEIGIARMAVIINLLVKPMMKACYTCSTSDTESDTNYWHYALNVPFYTHFTSPIRRYADIVVHRLLASSLGYSEMPNWNSDDIQNIADNCNKKKNSAKKASEASSELFLKLYMEKNGPVKVRAVVIEVREKFFDVIDLSTRTLNRVYVDKIKSAQVKFKNDEGMCSLIVNWKSDGEIAPVEQMIQIFTIIDVQMAYNKLVNKVTVTLLRPSS